MRLWATRDRGSYGVSIWAGAIPVQLSDGDWVPPDAGTWLLANITNDEAVDLGLVKPGQRLPDDRITRLRLEVVMLKAVG